MNTKGFTLVELVATIALLAVISIISFVSINEVVDQSRVNDCKNLLSSIRSAAKEYVSNNRYKSDFIDNVDEELMSVEMDAKSLIDGNYLSGSIVNPFDSSEEINASNIRIVVQLKDNYAAKDVYLYKRTVLEDGNYDDKVLECIKEEW